MEFYTGPKGSGKTTLLIHKSAETGATIVCGSCEEAKRIYQQAVEEGLEIKPPITHKMLLNNGGHRAGATGLLIDDLNGLFEQLTNIPILAVTGTTGE